MEVIADLQIHSKYARATSKDLSFENLEKYSRMKGLNLLGAGDFQHPEQIKEIKKKLKEDDKGILWTKTGFPFLWQTEISLMFAQGGKKRAVHLLVFSPNGKVAEKIIGYLDSKGRLDYDGRPIFGITCRDFVKDIKDIDERIEIIPAHCMTPFFGLFGSKSGFDSLHECFGDQADKIYAVESGMSADPSMLWRFKEISEGKNIVSFSDAHSYWPWRIGREATIFELEELSYGSIIKAIRTGDGLKATIETPPEYGKYHWDGHRSCGFSCSPEETKKLKGICPVCKEFLTIGVDFRVEEIAFHPKNYKPSHGRLFYKILPLHELVVLFTGRGIASKENWEIYSFLIEKFDNEFNILLHVKKEDLLKEEINPKLVDLIIRNREQKIKVKPGYDGEYGIAILEEQKRLF
ncbi:MAG: endonuclease Q family protein [Candidatus Pacearchaeota archaeon]